MVPLGMKFALFCTLAKPLVQKSAIVIPSGTVLKKSENSTIYIFIVK